MASASVEHDTASEYRAAREQAGLADLRERGVLAVTGPQRQKFLQGLLSNDVAGLVPGQGCQAAMMTARGGLLALVRVLVEEDAVALETLAERLPLLQRSLEHYRVGAPVRFAVREVAVLGLVGPQAAAVLERAGAALPPEAADAHVRASLTRAPVRIVRAADLPGGGFVLHLDPDAAGGAASALREAGATSIGREALDVLRIEAMRPWYGPDIGEENLLHETGLLAECHSKTKGCYVGQEVVARLEGRGGHVNKALRGLRLSAPAASGAPITDEEEKEVGRVTTAAVSPRLGPIALGYVHRNRFAAGTAVRVDGAPATVVERFEQP